MNRLNFENNGIFYPSASILILNSLVSRAFEIIRNDIKIITIPWDFKTENEYFNFYVGECVGASWHRIFSRFFHAFQINQLKMAVILENDRYFGNGRENIFRLKSRIQASILCGNS